MIVSGVECNICTDQVLTSLLINFITYTNIFVGLLLTFDSINLLVLHFFSIFPTQYYSSSIKFVHIYLNSFVLPLIRPLICNYIY